MLGDQIGEETGKVTGFRVLDAAGPKVEVSFQTKGKILGSDYQGRASYWSQMQPGGFLYGEGQGMYMTSGGTAVWKGQGTGKINRAEAQAIAAQFISRTPTETWIFRTFGAITTVTALVKHCRY